MNVQDLIDKEAYPPTHIYDVASMSPYGILKERLDIIERTFPEFFSIKENFLDVGSNKGFFLLKGSQFFDRCVGFDIKQEFVNIGKNLPSNKITCDLGGFFEFYDKNSLVFDRVFLGNCYHYIYIEDGFSWSWISKLAEIVKPEGLVLIEGPVDNSDTDVQTMNVYGIGSRQVNEEEVKDFTYEKITHSMELYFESVRECGTSSYYPQRKFMMFKRKP